MDTWRTAIVDAGPDHIRVRGRDDLELMREATFTDLTFLQSPAAEIAAGVLTIGDEHGGAGSGCMELIDAGLRAARREGAAFDAIAARMVDEARTAGNGR